MKWNSMLAYCLLIVSSAVWAGVWNNPHLHANDENILYSAIVSSPKTLDPAQAYTVEESQVISQIYEPTLQYHFLKRPYQLEPLTVYKMPKLTYLDAQGRTLPQQVNPAKVAYTLYDLEIKPGIFYQPHPAFATNQAGDYLYLHMTPAQLRKIRSLADFTKTGTKELVAEDYVYEIKRIASPKVSSPIYGFMQKHIAGFEKFSQTLQKALQTTGRDTFLDLRHYQLAGVKARGRYRLQIKIHGIYPQFKYWLAMNFFAPVPWQVDAFYSQPELKQHNITLAWFPVGTGPYMLIENNPNKRMVLVRNPNYHIELYPTQGEKGDKEKGYLAHAGQRLPLINKIILTLDKESIPRWNKFLQGYYDSSEVGADSFDQVIRVGKDGKPFLTKRMEAKGIRLNTSVIPGIFFVGFNMLDPIVGGYSEQKKKLRQAISIALNYEEYISIFLNGRGIPAQGPIPPTIFGYEKNQAGMNPYVYRWVNGKARRRSVAYAKKLMQEAGYANGIDPETKKPLIINYDVATTGSPDNKAYFSWLREQFAKLGIQLNIEATLYNRFQDKVRSGKVQLFFWGWLADYPDPENFLFLLYGPNSKVEHGGENATNYENPIVDALFEEIRVLPNGVARQKKIQALIALVQQDSPWVWGYYPISFALVHQWVDKHKVNPMANNALKYYVMDARKRKESRRMWNQPTLWPFALLVLFLLMIIIPLVITYYYRENRPTVKRKKMEDNHD